MSFGKTLSSYIIRNNDVDETRIANVFVLVTVVFKYVSMTPLTPQYSKCVLRSEFYG